RRINLLSLSLHWRPAILTHGRNTLQQLRQVLSDGHSLRRAPQRPDQRASGWHAKLPLRRDVQVLLSAVCPTQDLELQTSDLQHRSAPDQEDLVTIVSCFLTAPSTFRSLRAASALWPSTRADLRA